ncbi:MAG: NAD(P)H-dependent glycerol-3-phosphate dehydrogenase [Clostridia bacterium]|nr:NAD(P)H-dependent glycerol-3-phosphate dehydrogenase [Clostridia bacterium]
MKISILGLGAYGIALATIFNENDNKVSMWSKFKDEVDIVKLKRENINVFPGVKIQKGIEITDSMKECVEGAKIIVLALPMAGVREVCKELVKYLTEDQVLCLVTKGIEQNTNKLASEVVYEETKSEHICMLSGPSFAIDLVNNNETGLIVASKSSIAQITLKVCLENEKTNVGISKDIIGVEIAAASKNVFAILMGYLEGKNLSDSTRAAVLSCLANDLRIMIEILGGKAHTVFSYAGLGDLLLTCMSSKSRNFTLGKYLGMGYTTQKALEEMKTKTVEGLFALDSLNQLLKEKEITINSIDMLYKIIYENLKVDKVLKYIKR